MDFGERLQNLRKERGMSQEDLATILNVSRQAVSKWESGSAYPETEKIIAICKMFDTSMDELIGLKNSKIKSSNKIINKINAWLDMFINGLKMFYSMTFLQKILCLIEMGIYLLIVVCFIGIFHVVIGAIGDSLFYMLNDPLYGLVKSIFSGILLAVYFLITIIIMVKLFKIRYLDYYNEYETNKSKQIVNEDEIERKITVKEEKIIIRDVDNGFNPFEWLKKITRIFIKSFMICINIPLIAVFVILISLFIILLSLVKKGIIILFAAFIVLSIIIGCYIVIEIIIKYVFNLKQSPKRLFIMFIFALLLCGISSGLFAIDLSTYSFVNTYDYSNLISETSIEMKDNLIIEYINHPFTEIIYEDRDDIYVEFYINRNESMQIHNGYTYERLYNKNKRYIIYGFYNYYNSDDIRYIINNLLDDMSDKKISINDNMYAVNIKIYISEDNYKVLDKNWNEMINYYDE